MGGLFSKSETEDDDDEIPSAKNDAVDPPKAAEPPKAADPPANVDKRKTEKLKPESVEPRRKDKDSGRPRSESRHRGSSSRGRDKSPRRSPSRRRDKSPRRIPSRGRDHGHPYRRPSQQRYTLLRPRDDNHQQHPEKPTKKISRTSQKLKNEQKKVQHVTYNININGQDS